MYILVAEANPAAEKIMGKIMADGGYRTVFVSDVKAVWTTLQTEAVDMALLDWKYARAADFLLLKKVRTDQRIKTLPVLLMASSLTREDLAEAVKAGATNFIAKPFSLDQLRRKISDTVKGAKAQAPVQAAASQSLAQAEIMAKKLFLRGFEKLQLRKFAAAVEDFTRALKHNQVFPEAYKGIAEALKGSGDLARARQFLQKASETYVLGKNFEEAERLYVELKKADPNTPNPFKIIADQIREHGSLEFRIQVLAKAAEISPRDADLWVQLSLAHRENGDEDKAKDIAAWVLENVGDVPALADIFLSITGEDWYSNYSKEAMEEKLRFLDELEAKKNAVKEKRGAARIPMADYAMQIYALEDTLPVVDLSSTGIGFKPMTEKFAVGDALEFDLMAYGVLKIRGMKADVVRFNKIVVGAHFQKLSPRQAKQLEVILEGAASSPAQ